MKDQKTLHFHVGAHKTATTYMQSRLRTNRAQLRSEGVDYIDLWSKGAAERQYRKRLKKIIERDVLNEHEMSQLSGRLRDIVANGSSPSNSLVVISYENILGGFDLTRSNAPYPHAAAAIRHIVETFTDHRVRVFLSIRSLDRFLESGYLQRVTSRLETRTFRQYIRQVDVPALSWLPAVRAVESVIGSEDLILWEYERFRSDEAAIWNALLDKEDAEAALVEPARKDNQSLSAKGLKYLRNINKIATPADAKKFRNFIKESFGTQAGLKPPKLLRDARRQQLIDNYERDRRELSDSLGRRL